MGVHSQIRKKRPQSPEHSSWETRGMCSCESTGGVGTRWVFCVTGSHICMLLLCWVMPMLPLASASLGGKCCQGQSWPAMPGDRYGRLSGWNLLLSYTSWRLWTWFLTSSPSFSLSSSVLLSVNCQSPVDSIGEMYLKDYPKHFEHIQGTLT